jgi:protein-S-isoprenylcysteine O-methyltransferase Ste14
MESAITSTLRAEAMRATEFEFRHRWWIIAGIFVVGFWCYSFDHVSVSVAVARWLLGRSVPLHSPATRHVVQAVLGVGAVLVILSAAIRTWGAAYLRSEVVHDQKLHAEVLVADGPYRYVRNPLYLGMILLVVGFATMASRIGCLALVVLAILFTYRLILREESELREVRGDSYQAFLAVVPRLWPSFKARLPSGERKPLWGQAWLGESFGWLFACATVVYAATLKLALFYAILAAAFVVRFTVVPRLGRRTGDYSSR